MKKVLIVDSSSAMRGVLTTKLRNTGLPIGTIHEASDAHEAMELMRQWDFSLVLCDVCVSRSNSLELLMAIKADSLWHNIPVVVITRLGQEAPEALAMHFGASGFIRKPYVTDEVREKLAKIIGPAK